MEFLHAVIAMCSAFHDIERDGAIVVELAVGMLAPTLTVADGWRDQRKKIKYFRLLCSILG